MKRSLTISILIGSMLVPAAPAFARILDGDEAGVAAPAADLTAHERVITGAFTSPMAFSKAAAFVGIDRTDAHEQLPQLRDAILHR